MSEQILVLSPGPANEAGSFDEIYNDAYLGGETRMRAAVTLSRHRQSARFIMVGGCNISPVFGSDKVDAMIDYVRSRNPHASDRLVARPSLPCTYHNLVAAFTLLHKEGVLERPDTQISILTNEYHGPRVLAQAVEVWRQIAPDVPMKLQIPSAEAIMGVDIENDIEAMYPAEYARRIDMEAQGIKDIYNGTYTDSCFDRYGEELAPVLADHRDELLTASELQSLYVPQ